MDETYAVPRYSHIMGMGRVIFVSRERAVIQGESRVEVLSKETMKDADRDLTLLLAVYNSAIWQPKLHSYKRNCALSSWKIQWSTRPIGAWMNSQPIIVGLLPPMFGRWPIVDRVRRIWQNCLLPMVMPEMHVWAVQRSCSSTPWLMGMWQLNSKIFFSLNLDTYLRPNLSA